MNVIVVRVYRSLWARWTYLHSALDFLVKFGTWVPGDVYETACLFQRVSNVTTLNSVVIY